MSYFFCIFAAHNCRFKSVFLHIFSYICIFAAYVFIFCAYTCILLFISAYFVHIYAYFCILDEGWYRPKDNSNSTQIIPGFWADKTSTTHWSGCRVQVWVHVQAPACHLAITPKGCLRRQSKVLTAKSMAQLLGQRSCNAWAGLTGKHKHRVFPSWLQLLLAGLRKTCYHSCYTDSVRESKRF